MKKVISVLLSLAMLAVAAVSASAAMPETSQQRPVEITPRYSFTNSTKTITSSKMVDGTKVILSNGSVTGYRGVTTKITIELELQKLEGDDWVTVEQWSTTVDRHRASLEKTKEVDSGTYRTFATYSVFSGDQCEVIGSSSEPYEFS